jgi:hypothetical protein
MKPCLAKIFVLCAGIGLLAGCAGYHVGPVNGMVARENSVEIVPFNNQTLQPRLGDSVTQALRERFQTDGTYRLATHNDGDLIVTGVIGQYKRQGLSYLSRDVATTANYRIALTARVTVRERSTNKLLLDKVVEGYTLVHVGLSLADAERQSAPLLAQDLARNITELITEGAW